MSELGIIATVLKTARCPEDVFGRGALPSEVRSTFHQILKTVHPDKHNGSPLATKTTEMLTRMKTVADERIKNGTWGQQLPLPEFETVELGGRMVVKTSVSGDICDVYLGTEVVKVARNADDNDLLRAERFALDIVASRITTPVAAGVPKLVDSFRVGRREANVIERVAPGFVSAKEIRERVPGGVDARALVWMFKRLLVILEWTHHCGLVHGAILPPHVMFRVDDASAKLDQSGHTARLIDWCYSVEFAKRTRLSSWVPAWKDFYAPELLSKESVSPASDLYMAAALIVYLAGGSSAALSLPEPLKTVLLLCTEPQDRRTYQKAGEVFEDWNKAAKKVFGAPKWNDFILP